MIYVHFEAKLEKIESCHDNLEAPYTREINKHTSWIILCQLNKFFINSPCDPPDFAELSVPINAGFDSTTLDSYFTTLVEIFTSHILAESTFSRIV